MTLYSESIKPTIKSVFINNVLEGFVAQGCDSSRILDSVGLNAVADMGSLRISVAQFYKLTLAIQEALQDEMLGFFPKPVPIGSTETLAKIAVNLPTLGDVLETLNDFYALFNDRQPVLAVTNTTSQTCVTLCCNTPLQKQSKYYKQCLLLSCYKILCWLATSKLALSDVSFDYPLDDDREELAFVFDCQQIRESDSVSLTFTNNVLSKPVLQTKDAVQDYQQNHTLYTLLWPDVNNLETQIRQLISSHISTGFPTLDEVAINLDTSSQTLSRRLSENGIKYQTIKDNLRRDAAIALLMNSGLTIKEIAFQLGFKESSSFSKAFKQWAGVPPTVYRE